MEYRDYYATLGVDKGATQADIKKAYRRLAREHHPDVNTGDTAAERRFKEISEANEVLSDPQKRKAYDQLGANWASYERAGGAGGNPFTGFAGAAGRPGTRYQFHGDAADLSGFSDFFRAFFGDAGAEGDVGGQPFEPLFGGLGGDSGAGHAASGFGTGSPRGTRRPAYRAPADATADTTVSLEEVLHGTERHIEVGGKRLEVRIPQGVADGQRIRLSGRAEGGGHIYITVHVAQHPIFSRDGDNLGMELPLTLGEALLGAQVSLEALSGKRLLLTIPPGTQAGRLFRLAGQGLPRFGGGAPGDLRVRTTIVLPTNLDEEGARRARALVEHIAQPDPRQAAASRR
jgi:curved DNA-binding protein